MTAATPSAMLNQFSPLSLVRMAWKGKVYIVVVWVLASVMAAIIALRLPAMYRAETVILVDSQKIPERYVTSIVSTDVSDRLATISQQILSSTRLKKIIEDFDLYKEQRRTLAPEEMIELVRRDIAVRIDKGGSGGRPGAFRVGYQGPNAAVVAAVANRLATLYIDENLRVREVQAEGTTEFIENQLKEAKQRLDEMEAAVSRYKIQHSGDLPEQQGVLNGVLSRLQIELQGNQDATNRAQQNKILLENSLRLAEGEVAVLTRSVGNETVAKDGVVPLMPPATTAVAPQKRSEVLQAQLNRQRSRYSDDHPDVKRLREELAGVKAIEETQEASTAPAKADPTANPSQQRPVVRLSAENVKEVLRAREHLETIKTQIQLVNQELAAREKDRERILKEIGHYQARLSQVPLREQDMAALTRDYEISKANYRSLLDKKLLAEMAADLERRQKSERFTVLDPAQPPQKPFKPKRTLIAGIGSVLGLALGAAIAFGKELKSGALLGEWELPKTVPVVGRIPKIRIRKGCFRDGATAASKRRCWKPGLPLIASLLVLVAGAAAGGYFMWTRF